MGWQWARSPMVCTMAFIVCLMWFSFKEERRALRDFGDEGSDESTMIISVPNSQTGDRESLPFLRERQTGKGKRKDAVASDLTSHQAFNDYGEEDYGEASNGDTVAASLENADDAGIIEDSDEPSSNKERLKMYLERDDSVIDPEFKNSKRIVVDASFHFFRDQYGLINPTFSVQELEDILRDVSRTWMRGNIWVRFKRLPSEGKPLSDKAADALRWWVFGYKDAKTNRTRFWQDVKLFLCNGLSKMSMDEAEREVLKRYNEFGGHSLMNWILGVGANPQKMAINLDVITVGFWPWYNGGAIRGRVFVRGGSCSRDVYASAGVAKDDAMHPICNGWKIDHEAGTDMSAAEMGRILSHEFGHIFGLAHPAKGACQFADSRDELVLMAQQRSVAVKGTECSITNPDAKYSRYVRQTEMARARTVALFISQQQRKLSQQTINA